MAKINNWFLMAGCLVGEITDHPRQHEFRGKIQITSPVLGRDKCSTWKAGDTVETFSGTTYVLGEPYDTNNNKR